MSDGKRSNFGRRAKAAKEDDGKANSSVSQSHGDWGECRSECD